MRATRGEGTLDLAVRATAALADAYIHRRDRVGLVSFGGILRWLLPGMGTVQLYRIVDALLDTEIILSYYWTEIDVMPRRTLPPNALVIALSPLLDRRSVGALLDLRARGFDLAVIDISPRALHDRGRPKGSTPSPTTSGRSGATRCAIACSRRASPSPSGATASRCRQSSRR